MLMSKVQRDDLPDSAIALLDIMAALHSAGLEWVSRVDLAESQDKKRLNPQELTHLEYLYSLGFIDAYREVGDPTIQYRIK